MGLFDRYERVRLLGRGGAGDVHLVRDRLQSGRELALKSITARVDDVIRAAFEREFATLATLQVPGVAQVYDFGIEPARAGGDAPRPFFTRAYVAGEPLDNARRERSLDARLALLLRAADVIAPLHRVGVVHGDIKPGNVIIDADERAWLIDFGLARARTPEHAREVHGALGTPSFMAPELLRGGTPSVAGDVYALGVTLFWLITGAYPYAELGPREWSARLDGQRAPLPQLTDARARAALEVAARALEPAPEQRFPCVEELIASLERTLPAQRERADVERTFVLPRPRGNALELAQLERELAADGGGSRSWVVLAAAGGGKTLLLHELKWRRQLASQLVLEIFAGRAPGALPLISLFEQLLTVLGPMHAESRAGRAMLEQLQRGHLPETAAADALSGLLQAVAAESPLAVFVDDLDQADASFGAVLRSALHAHALHPVAIIATACDASAPAVRELQADQQLELPRLSPEDSAALCTEALGPLDATVLAALVEHGQGLPGALASAFYTLSSLSAVTPKDVAQLPPDPASLALARGRTCRLDASARRLLDVLALISALPETVAQTLSGSHPLQQLLDDGFLVRAGDQLLLADGALRKALSSTLGSAGRQQLAAASLAAPWSQTLHAADRASLAVIAGDDARVLELVPSAAEALVQAGASARAAELLQALVACSSGEAHERACLRLASLRHALGEDARAAELAGQLAQGACSSERQAEARLLEARALTALGRWDDAITALASVPENAPPARRAQVQRELAKVHLRRGDYAAVSRAVEQGLACAAADDPVRIELLCNQGLVAGYAGDQSVARSCYDQALAIARARGEKSDEAAVLTYLAIGAQRAGDMLSARDLSAQSLEIARELGDVGNMARFSMNLGAIFYFLGEHAQAAEHYDSAARLARRAGRSSTRMIARANLAHLHLYFGLYERARSEIEEISAQAQAAGQQVTVAHLTAYSAELLARTGEVERALIAYDDAVARYTKLGRTREVIEHNLDAADTLLERGGPADASAAAGYLARAREHLAREPIEDLRMRLDLAVARARLANAEPDAAAIGCEDVVSRARLARNRDVEWSALSALAMAQQQCGSTFAAKRSARAAVEVLEDIALRVPREHREAFWHDPRRRAVRDYVNQSEHTSLTQTGGPETRAFALDQERERLFQIIRRLASEHDLPRLLERIIESAVDLSGAERGSVLLVDSAGHLTPQITHSRQSLQDEAHAQFSRSIAEAVLIDGEPIVTFDAVADGRLQSYISVHKLALRSVACLPIRGHTGTVGVLYLEHRRSRGRFSESSVELLSAFADQAAIAIENARMLDEIRAQKRALEDANRELSEAKAKLEDLLIARTRQLDEVQRELARATQRSDANASRHGMIGKSAGMRRVFDAMNRLSGNTVPVVICGETGTGKELVARAIHYSGARAAAPFVTIDCGSLPESLLESELFGYVKGAFSGADRDRRGLIAAASGGTLFLDEVSEMPAKMQASLLRVLQERKVCRLGSDVEEAVDVRLLTATRRPLSELVQRGLFREDLLYRLSVVELMLPPLRDRRDDIPLLCDHLLREFAQRESIPRCHLTRHALAVLMDQPWPGNVRQLGHVLLQACVMTEGTTIDAADLAFGDSAHPPPSPLTAADANGHDGIVNPSTLLIENLNHHKQEEKQRILHALEASGWNRVKAAQALGMPRRTFYRRLADYSIL
jgi:transcriptional regulator with GAF, ATPase, and Fis domain/tetratricopeptide (TPR) repeat protein/predicted Ser/Thr protein kinase